MSVYRCHGRSAVGHVQRQRDLVTKASILVVDDEPGVRSALSGVLRDEGYDVDAVDSGEECLDRVVATCSMSSCSTCGCGLDGLVNAGRLRQMKIDAQVVMISGHGNSSRVKAIKLGRSILSRNRCRSKRPCSSSATRCGSGASRPKTVRCAHGPIVPAGWSGRAHHPPAARAGGDGARQGRVLIFGRTAQARSCGADGARAEPPRNQPFVEVNCAAIRGDHRERAVRPCEGGVYGRGGRSQGSSGGAERDDLSRRDRRHEPEDASKCCACSRNR